MIRVVPGIHSVLEVLKVRPRTIKNIWVKPDPVGPELNEIIALSKRFKISLDRPKPQAMSQKVESHQGVIAFVEETPEWPSRAHLQERSHSLIFALDGVLDPHNLGSLMRTLWNLGGLGLISPRDRAVSALSPAAQKVASGAFEHLPVLEVVNLGSELKALKELGFWIYGLAALQAEEGQGSQPLWDVKVAEKAVFVVGAESTGIRKPVLGACDVICHIPNIKDANSFNASVAGAIAGYEYRRQHPQHLK